MAELSLSVSDATWTMDATWLIWAAVTVAVAAVLRWVLGHGNALDTAAARRHAWKAYWKDESYYLSRGVHASEEFIRNSRGVEIFTKQWLPANGIMRGVVFYCHGYGDTCAYFFEDVAMRLAAAQYAVVGMDYEGHGQSQGLHCYIKRFDTIVDDVIEFATLLKGKREFRGLPFFLCGESMGGAVAIKTHRRQPLAWDGAIFLAPMCKISQDVQPHPLVVFLLKLLAWILPTAQLVPSRDICELTFKVPEKRVLGENNPTAFKGKPRLWTAVQLLATTDEIGANLNRVTLPLLILHGADDSVTDPEVSQALYDQSESTDKTIHLYEGCWHSLLGGEPDDVVERIMADIINWLDARSLAPGVAQQMWAVESLSPGFNRSCKYLDSPLIALEDTAAAESDSSSTVTT